MTYLTLFVKYQENHSFVKLSTLFSLLQAFTAFFGKGITVKNDAKKPEED